MNRILLIFLLLLTATFANKKEIYVKAKVQGNKVVVYLYNKSLHHITLKYNAQTKHLSALNKLPFTKSYPPKSKHKISEFYIKRKKFSYKGNITWVIGTQNAKHDDNFLYRLPYKVKTKEQVTQGFNGVFSHKGNSQYAVDFGMTKGTKIYASREGTVVKIKEDSKLGGNNRKYLPHANFAIVKHQDNTYAVYNHLLYNGVEVKEGQFIDEGELVGYSGDTGFNNGPHLHLVVYKTINIKQRQSIPIKFKAKRGIISNPIRGRYYTAVE